jgi:hypothetical protein
VLGPNQHAAFWRISTFGGFHVGVAEGILVRVGVSEGVAVWSRVAVGVLVTGTPTSCVTSEVTTRVTTWVISTFWTTGVGEEDAVAGAQELTTKRNRNKSMAAL